MAGGQFMNWLQSNPGIMQGVQTAVGGALGSIGKQNIQQPVPTQRSEAAPTPPANNNMIIYLGIAAVAVFFLMKKK